MGNPALPHLFGRDRGARDGAAGAVQETVAESARVRWQVYALRDQGRKLSRARALETGRQGCLTISVRTEPEAVLEDDHGNVLRRLDHVRVRVLRRSGAMLLHGTELRQDRWEIRDFPQAWWCVLIA